MRLLTTTLLGLLMVIFTGCGGKQEDTPKTRFVTIGTGGLTGVYYPTGVNIAKMVNDKKDFYGLKCTAESTGGSIFNINALMAGDLDFGITQSDRQFEAYNGLGDWHGKPQTDLRAVFSIHPELVTLVAADDAGIETLADLEGKRVNLGNLGSGHRRNAMDALAAAGIDPETDIVAERVKAAEAPGLLQDNRIDAFFYTVGHPSGAIKEAASGVRKVHFVPITEVGALLEKYRFYAAADIPIADYNVSNETPVRTFGVKATLVTSARVADDIVYAVTREVFENFTDFIKLHPAYAGLTRQAMLEGLSAPLHAGAKRYFAEAGLAVAD